MKYNLKYSGFKFIGDVPAHWATIKLRHVLSRNSEKNRADLPLLSVTREKGVIVRDTTYGDDNHNYIPEDLTNYKVVKPGQFAMNKMKAWQGSYGISQHEGIVSPAYYVFDVHHADTGFLHKVLRSKTYVAFFGQASDGVRTDQWDLNIDRMKSIPLFLPPVIVQQQIVRYLDYKNHLISKYIRIKKKQIELLKELKQSIINDAVTGKIDVRIGKPYPRYKDSGIDWIGMIPEEWEASRVKYLCNINANTLPENTDPEFRFIYHDIGSVGTGELLKQAECTKFAKSPSRARRVVYTNDVIISTVRTYLKAVYSFENITEPTVVSTGFAVFTPREMLLPKLLKYCMLGESFIQQVVINSVGIGYPAINESVLERLFLIYPNDVQTQITIGSFLEEKTRGIDLLHERLSLSIFKLKELQTRLISDVVTGKLDVRDIEIPDYDEEQEEYDEVVVEDSLEEVGDAD